MASQRGRRRTAATCGLALALTVGCTSDGEPSAGPATASTPAASPTTPDSSATTPTTAPTAGQPATTEPAQRRPFTIAVAGDVHFEGALADRLDDPATALAPATRTLARADLAIVNLETAVGTGGRPEPGKRYVFQAPIRAFAALAGAGIDVATMANNHVLDYGRRPLRGMFDGIERAAGADPPLAVVGVGTDVVDAFRPARTAVGGSVVATIGATVAGDDPTADPTGHWAATRNSPGTADALDPTRLLRTVARADASADVVVVYLHWGIQGERCPSAGQRSLASDLVAAGADIVVGSHTHTLQGDGPLRDGYVAYGLGNYAWYTPTSSTGVLTLTVDPATSQDGDAEVTAAEWEPARIGADGLPRRLSGAAADGFDAELASLRACAGLGR